MASFGAGWVTTHRHIPTMRRVGGIDIAVLADPRKDVARSEAQRLGVPAFAAAGSVDELPHSDEIDAITCGAAPQVHYALIAGALRAGKHVLTEKPFTMTVAEGEELVELARERDLTLCIVHNFQFSSSARKVQRWIDNGRIGRLRGIWAMQLSNPKRRLPSWYDQLPLGLFYDESAHLLYVARGFARRELEPLSVTVHPSTIGHENTPAQIDAQCHAGEIPVTVQMNFEAPLSEWHVIVMGENGMGVADLFRDIAVYTPNDSGHGPLDVIRTSLAGTFHHWLGTVSSGVGHLRGTLLYGNEEVFRRFRDAALGGPRPVGIDATDALAVLRVQHAIVEQGAAASPH